MLYKVGLLSFSQPAMHQPKKYHQLLTGTQKNPQFSLNQLPDKLIEGEKQHLHSLYLAQLYMIYVTITEINRTEMEENKGRFPFLLPACEHIKFSSHDLI